MRSPCASTVVRSNGATSTRSDEQPSLWGLSNVAAAASGRTPGVFATRSSAVAAPARAAHGAVASSATRASDCVARQANVAAASPDSHCLTRCVESRVASAVEHVPDRRRRRTRDAENSGAGSDVVCMAAPCSASLSLKYPSPAFSCQRRFRRYLERVRHHTTATPGTRADEDEED